MKITVETKVTIEYASGEQASLGKVTIHRAGDNPNMVRREVMAALAKNQDQVEDGFDLKSQYPI